MPMEAIARMQCDGPRLADVDICVRFTIPFVPAIGTMIAVTPEGDFVEVTDVYWHIDKPNVLDIGVKDGDGPLRPFSYWKKQGWKRDQGSGGR